MESAAGCRLHLLRVQLSWRAAGAGGHAPDGAIEWMPAKHRSTGAPARRPVPIFPRAVCPFAPSSVVKS
eukprot:scaffold14012_cov88-Isochrysis_galbana.AAC.5